MAGISDKVLKTQYAENKHRFNDGTELQNKEFSDGSGLELYTTDFRPYDPQIGRFTQIDELSQLDYNYSPYAFATDNPIDVNDPLGLDTLTRRTNLAAVTVTAKAKKPLDTQNGQVFPARSAATDFFLGHRTWVGHAFGQPVKYETNSKGYLTGNVAPNEMVFDLPVGDKPLNIKAVFRLKNFIKGEYSIYKGVKNGLDYYGKARGGIEFRYTLAEIEKFGIETIDGLESVSSNAAALGIEQLIIDLNGGAGTGILANKIPATVKPIYIEEGRYWLDTNMPNWEKELKFK